MSCHIFALPHRVLYNVQWTVGWRDFWRKKLGTRQVVPNCVRTPNPKCFSEILLIGAGPQKILTVTQGWSIWRHKAILFPELWQISHLLNVSHIVRLHCPRYRYILTYCIIMVWWLNCSVSDPYSLNPDPDPAKNLNPDRDPDPSYFFTLSGKN